MKRNPRKSARGRSATALALVLAVALGVAVTARAQAPPAPRSLLPDLQVPVPNHISLDTHNGHVFAGFDSSIVNRGEGPLEVEGTRTSTKTKGMVARQLVARSDGSTIAARTVGTLRWVKDQPHRYWHLDDVMRYELRRAGDFSLVKSTTRRGYCLRDGASFPRYCGRELPNLLSLIEGIAPARVSRWAPISEGQSFDVTTLPTGGYWLVERANPDGSFLESDTTNDATSVLLNITNDHSGRRRHVTMRIAGSCPGAERCSKLKSFAR